MKIIFIQDVKNVAKKGDVKDVSEGYARNFLFPRKLAQIATDAAIKSVEEKRQKEKKEHEANVEKMRQMADVLKGKEVVLKSKEKGGKLFGSISKKDIAQALKSAGSEVGEDKIILESPIKKIGAYEIEIKLTQEIRSKIRLKVEAQ